MNSQFARWAVPIAIAFAAIMVFATVYTITSDYRRSPQSADPAFAPTLIDVPEHFRRKLVLLRKRGSPTEHDGSELYRESFTSGWNDCAASFVANERSGSVVYWSYEPEGDNTMGAPWIIPAPDEVNEARRDGWRLCRSEIQALMKTRSESQVRAILAK
jgi:hypothetical protein